MKRLIMALPLVAGMAVLAGCAEGPAGDHTSPMYTAGGTYDAYYDNFYGRIYDGYWTGGTFNFRTAPNHHFQQDTAGHFRQQPTEGFQEIHGELHPGMPTGAPPAAAQPPQ